MNMAACFADRAEAGRQLAEKLTAYRDCNDVVVLALPRGGVSVACGVATRLHLPLDVFILRKLGIPGYEELAMGAIASGGIRVINESGASDPFPAPARGTLVVQSLRRVEVNRCRY